MRVLGLMSGTSLDGVDAAVLHTDGEQIFEFGPTGIFPYSAGQRSILKSAVSHALSGSGGAESSCSFAEASAVITSTHAVAVEQLLAASGPVNLIGFHGQTVLHRPERRLSIQLGSPEQIAEATGVAVVADMRIADLTAGGQGAPLVPAYHAALARRLGLNAPTAFLNIGGIANLTWIGPAGELLACDVGPGNGLIDQLVCSQGLGDYDAGGRLSASGHVDERALDELMRHPFFKQSGPRSLDRYDFGLGPVLRLDLRDAAATLAAFTAQAVSLAAERLPEQPQVWIVCGGGRHNRAIMTELANRLPAPCLSADDLGLRGDLIEAEAMAYLAARSVANLPLTYPGTTGVAAPLRGGRLVHAPRLQ